MGDTLRALENGARTMMQRAVGAVQSTGRTGRVVRVFSSRGRVVMRSFTFGRAQATGRASSRVRVVTRALFGGGSAQTTVPALEEIKLKDIDNRSIDPSKYVGKVLLVTNVASNCGFTASNYKDLVELYDKYRGDDFEILAFPCNQFGNQEPGSNSQIKDFTKKYGVEFQVTEKVNVNGPDTHPFFKYLKEKGPKSFLGNDAKWNFEKFLVDKDGNVVKRYLSTTSPLPIEKDIKKLL